MSNAVEQLGSAVHRESVAIADDVTIDIAIRSAASSSSTSRLSETTVRTMRLLCEWLGPPPHTGITVIDLPWGVGEPGSAQPGIASTRARWIAPVRDMTAERSLIAALARQFWFAADNSDAAFREGLAIYTATRAINRVLEGRNFAAPRFLGGFVPMPIRSLMLSPNLIGPGAPVGEFDEVLMPADAEWRFASAAPGAPARRAADALRTLERVIGWPAMQQVLADSRLRARDGAVTAELLTAVAAEQRGVSMQWFLRELVRSNDIIDYAVGGVSSVPSTDTVRTTVVVERRGSGVFSGTDRPFAAGPAQSFALLVRFLDGHDARAAIDGREQHAEIGFDSVVPAVAVAIDPDEIVLVDHNRINNTWASGAPRDPLGLRMVANWMIWLQNVMLAYTAIA